MRSTRLHQLAAIALIGALYTVLTLGFAPIAFGSVQFRVSEALVLLPLLSPTAIWGLTFGCFLSNLVGFLAGVNPLGLIDAFVGTLATLIAALLTHRIGKLPIRRTPQLLLAALPPVLTNGLLVGLELAFLFAEEESSFLPLFTFNAASVAIGEALVCYTLGILLTACLLRRDLYRKIFRFD